MTTISPIPQQRRGYTLVEMLIVVVLIGIMSAVAIRGMSDAKTSFTLDRAVQELQGEVRRAQSEAIRRNSRLTLSRLNDSTFQVAVTSSGTVIGQTRLPWPAKFGASSTASVVLQGFGQPATSASFVVTVNRRQRTLQLNSVGRISISAAQAL